MRKPTPTYEHEYQRQLARLERLLDEAMETLSTARVALRYERGLDRALGEGRN